MEEEVSKVHISSPRPLATPRAAPASTRFPGQGPGPSPPFSGLLCDREMAAKRPQDPKQGG